MGEVWSAHDTRLDRPVALKLLRADLTRDPEALAQFRTEAKSAAGLSHPAVVSVFDFGEQRYTDQDGVHRRAYLVMELVKGQTLHSLLRQGPPQPGRSVQIAAGIVHALRHAHQRGVVHRDIKPSNVMIQPSGAVKVMDFGIARPLARTGPVDSPSRVVMGTAYYMSPEQARGEEVDGRSDIYSAGCVLYEMLTGRRPFVGASPVLTVYKHLTDTAVAPSELVPGLPPVFDWAVARAMSRRPEERFASAAEFLDALASLSQAASGLPALTWRSLPEAVVVPDAADPAPSVMSGDSRTRLSLPEVTPSSGQLAVAFSAAPWPDPVGGDLAAADLAGQDPVGPIPGAAAADPPGPDQARPVAMDAMLAGLVPSGTGPAAPGTPTPEAGPAARQVWPAPQVWPTPPPVQAPQPGTALPDGLGGTEPAASGNGQAAGWYSPPPTDPPQPGTALPDGLGGTEPAASGNKPANQPGTRAANLIVVAVILLALLVYLLIAWRAGRASEDIPGLAAMAVQLVRAGP
jgi:hypothetical protein